MEKPGKREGCAAALSQPSIPRYRRKEVHDRVIMQSFPIAVAAASGRGISETNRQEFEKVVSCACACEIKFEQVARRQKQLGASNSSQAFATEIISWERPALGSLGICLNDLCKKRCEPKPRVIWRLGGT